MDKAQKELVKTYFRKRKIDGIFESYELKYGIKEGYLDKIEMLKSYLNMRNLDLLDTVSLNYYKHRIYEKLETVRNNEDYYYFMELIDLIDKLIEKRNG